MANPVRSYSIPNLIQGVSQQAPQQRRDSQCQEQLDCLNSPVDGATARPGMDVIKFLSVEDLTDAYCFDIQRGDLEHYLVSIKDGSLRAFDLMDGTECGVSVPDGAAYMEVSGVPRDSFVHTTVSDFTFIGNQEVIPAMQATSSPAAANEALFHFRAGNYSTKYQLAILYNSKIYTWTYKTPDNSTSGNADYIATNQLAATFYRALTGSAATPTTSGEDDDGSFPHGVGAAGAGDSGNVTGAVTATSLGFEVSISGNAVRISRSDTAAFSIDVSDGLGNTHMIGFKDGVQSFADLPARAFEGMKVKVKGEDNTQDDDYYVSYSDGLWVEDIGPDVSLGVDASTMPWQLVNTGYRTFTLEKAPWGARLVGDASSNPSPSFIGQTIQDLFYSDSRLAILTEGSAVWSKARNSYVYFKDTAQTVLQSDPVDETISATKHIALLRRAVQAPDTLLLWAQRAQIRIDSNQDKFAQDTVSAKPAASYEFAEQAAPLPIGSSLYFAAEPGEFSRIRDLLVDNGRIRGDVDVTEHVPRYVPKSLRWLVGSDTTSLLALVSDDDQGRLYVYQWLVSGQERVQSAWNIWRLPSDCVVLWAGCTKAKLHMLVQRSDGVAIVEINLVEKQQDPEGVYLTRLDMKITEADLVSATYDSTTEETTLTLPYEVPEAADDASLLLVVVRENGSLFRGTQMDVTAVSGAEVNVKGDVTEESLYIGFRISAERLESEFYVRTDKGSKPFDRLQVENVRFVHSGTGYYRAEVVYANGKSFDYPHEGREFGDPGNQLDKVALSNGYLEVPVQAENTAYTLRLVNDSFLPSAWQTAEYHYRPANRV